MKQSIKRPNNNNTGQFGMLFTHSNGVCYVCRCKTDCVFALVAVVEKTEKISNKMTHHRTADATTTQPTVADESERRTERNKKKKKYAQL